MTDIVFEPLPDPKVGGKSAPPRGADHSVIAEALRAHPGQWARILAFPARDSASTTANSIRKGVRSAWAPAGAFEAKARTVDGEHRVYARYVGIPSA